ncbi:MAG: penicillin-binding protein activator [Acidiferrobacterales bacterium]
MKPIFSARFRAALFILAGFLTLQGCQTQAPLQPVSPRLATRDAKRAERAGEYVIAAHDYQRIAQLVVPPERQRLQLNAVDALVKAAQVREAREQIQSIDTAGLAPSFLARKLVLEARIASLEGRPRRSISLLDKAARMRNLDPSLQAEILQTRARIEIKVNRPISAVNDLIARERFIVSGTEITANQQQLWHILQTLSRANLERALKSARSPALIGWLQLAITVTDNSGDPNQLAMAVSAWRKSHPNHPATDSFIKSLASPVPGIIGRINRIALLLPLTSDFSKQAEAVRDGFMAMDAANKDPDKPKIVVYDTGPDPAQITKYYNAAVANGAQFVVGPLGHDAVSQLVKTDDLQVPTLLLSRTNQKIDPSKQVFQFGLPLEQEAKQVAERAYLDGHRRAGILYPNTAWGLRIANGFADAFQRLGGIVLTSVAYQHGAGDYSQPVKRLLNINQSDEREKRLENLLQIKLKFEPRPRKDIDMIFLEADAQNGRLIKPQLNYYRAMQIPVYATSHIFTGKTDPMRDTDLDGIMFGDMPWMLIHDGSIKALRTELQQGDWKYAHTALDRLYALGIDSYAVIPQLNRLSSEQGVHFDGVTSSLSIGPHGRFRRQLLWAQFQKGVPQLLDTFLSYKGQFALDDGAGIDSPSIPTH